MPQKAKYARIGSGDDFADGVYACLAALLQSPGFLYQLEGAPGRLPSGAVALGPHAVAARLSYALWNTLPDAALFAAANRGLPPGALAAEADRLLDDPRAVATVRDFHRQLLGIDNYTHIQKGTALFPNFTETLPESMAAET